MREKGPWVFWKRVILPNPVGDKVGIWEFPSIIRPKWDIFIAIQVMRSGRRFIRNSLLSLKIKRGVAGQDWRNLKKYIFEGGLKEEWMEVKINKLSEKDIEQMGVASWPIWEKEVSRFDWFYDTTEECYLLEGEVTVETDGGEKVTFGKGDFVTFPEGLSCVWDVKKPVRKHYRFK